MHTYWCSNCVANGDFFPETDERTIFLCPVCKSRMYYSLSEDIDDKTGKVIKRWVDEERQKSHPKIKNSQPPSPTITCPYCKSTDCKKISGLSKAIDIGLFGIFALGKTTKQWHCNNCKSDF